MSLRFKLAEISPNISRLCSVLLFDTNKGFCNILSQFMSAFHPMRFIFFNSQAVLTLSVLQVIVNCIIDQLKFTVFVDSAISLLIETNPHVLFEVVVEVGIKSSVKCCFRRLVNIAILWTTTKNKRRLLKQYSRVQQNQIKS